jgi:hypothetical protein
MTDRVMMCHLLTGHLLNLIRWIDMRNAEELSVSADEVARRTAIERPPSWEVTDNPGRVHQKHEGLSIQK